MKDSNVKRKHLFGRNLFTLCILIPSTFILLAVICIMISYISAYNSNKVTPFVDRVKDITNSENNTEFTESDYKINDLERVSIDDFNDYGIMFACTNYSEDENSISFSLKVYMLEDSEEVIETMTANVCVASNWLGFVAYGSKTTNLRVASDYETAAQSNTYRRTFSVTVDADTFPSKVANTWPIKVAVKEPTYFLYLEWQYYDNGKATTKAKVIEIPYNYSLPEIGGYR